jgi:glycosyltransferase involved in cell wall biosynthesis
MKIILDPQIFIHQKFGGISRYYTEIYKALKDKKVNILCPIIYSENLHLKEYSYFKNNWQEILKLSSKFSCTLDQKIKLIFKKIAYFNTLRVIKKQQFDLFIPTYFDTYFLKKIGSKPFVLTVYDMINELFPQFYLADKTTVPNKKLLMEKATKIIAISDSTKRDIIKLYPNIDSSKIEIVYLGYTIKKDIKVNLNLPEDYILFVGNRQTYKNFIFLLKSISSTLRNNPNLFLVCAGGNALDESEIKFINELGVGNKIIQRNFKDNELATYYSNAKCFVFPSEYEGFGIPVLESMACGCPVVLSNHSSFPEVAGEAGVYFELKNEIDLKNKIENLLVDHSYRNQYSLKGLEQVKKFSWDICAENIYKIYQSVIK